MLRLISVLLLLAALALSASCNSGVSSKVMALSAADLQSFIPLTQALDIAKQEVPDGVPVEVELEIEDDDENEPPAFEVVLFVPGSNVLMEVEVDAKTGKVLEVEVEEDGEDDEE